MLPLPLGEGWGEGHDCLGQLRRLFDPQNVLYVDFSSDLLQKDSSSLVAAQDLVRPSPPPPPPEGGGEIFSPIPLTYYRYH
jgi:hypothetical protein